MNNSEYLENFCSAAESNYIRQSMSVLLKLEDPQVVERYYLLYYYFILYLQQFL